jgi:hypothetical protein
MASVASIRSTDRLVLGLFVRPFRTASKGVRAPREHAVHGVGLRGRGQG